MMPRLRVAVCSDFPEEGWPSMDRVATMLLESLRRLHADTIAVTPVAPQFVRRATRMWGVGRGRTAHNADRLVNRLWEYPRHVAALDSQHDVFHVIDHSYSQLLHRLPPQRTVVTCHDLDMFRSVLTPAEEPRSRPFRAMARHVLAGFQRAARVTCDTAAIRDELVAGGVVSPERVIVAPVGVGPRYTDAADSEADRAAAALVSVAPGAIEILHVGSTIPRKRIDRLLTICGEVRRERPDIHLIRAGGSFTDDQQQLADTLGIRVSVLSFLDERILAAIYRRAAFVLQTSDREGFGLPLIEAMACGTPVVATDLAVLREVGGAAVEYCPGDSIASWCRTVLALIDERRDHPERWAARRAAGIERAARFTWSHFAERLAHVYADIAAEAGVTRAVEVSVLAGSASSRHSEVVRK